jgi:hypothetical protein
MYIYVDCTAVLTVVRNVRKLDNECEYVYMYVCICRLYQWLELLSAWKSDRFLPREYVCVCVCARAGGGIHMHLAHAD